MTEQNINNIKAQMRKGMLEYCILLYLNEHRAYPSDILKRLLEANMLVVEGTLYTLLNRLKREDKLSYEWEESNQGPPRKYYIITPEGREALEVMSKAWDEISGSVNYFRNTANQNL